MLNPQNGSSIISAVSPFLLQLLLVDINRKVLRINGRQTSLYSQFKFSHCILATFLESLLPTTLFNLKETKWYHLSSTWIAKLMNNKCFCYSQKAKHF